MWKGCGRCSRIWLLVAFRPPFLPGRPFPTRNSRFKWTDFFGTLGNGDMPLRCANLLRRQSATSDDLHRSVTRPDRNLRIAMMLDSDGPGGAEMMVFCLSEELGARGHTVVPVLPRNGVGWLGDLFRSAGYSPETFWLKGPVDPTGVGRLMKLFRQHNIDVVHSHEFTMAVYGSTAARLLAIPHILTMHGGLTITKALRRRIALRWAIRRSAHAVAVSDATRMQFAKDLGLRTSAFTVVHNGVPLTSGNAEQVRREFGCTDGDVVILAVANLEPNKNHRMLLEALVRLHTTGSQCRGDSSSPA